MNELSTSDWIREEHEKLDALVCAMRAKVVVIPRANLTPWIEAVRAEFARLRAHLQKHMALEEAGGYLVSVTERRPTLTSEVKRLEHEHRELGTIMTLIRDELNSCTVEDRLLVRDVCKRIRALLSYVEHHEQEENMLVSSAFSDDIGSKD